jgi:hypothetical protein
MEMRTGDPNQRHNDNFRALLIANNVNFSPSLQPVGLACSDPLIRGPRKEDTMVRKLTFAALITVAGLYLPSSAALAQTASPPTYQGDPDVYKVIFEDQNFRVIASTRKKGSMTRLTLTPFHQSSIFSPTA